MEDRVDLRTVFWRSLPVFVRRGDRDETAQELNLRLIAGCNHGTHAVKVRGAAAAAAIPRAPAAAR
jgi:hypothetical protein